MAGESPTPVDPRQWVDMAEGSPVVDQEKTAVADTGSDSAHLSGLDGLTDRLLDAIDGGVPMMPPTAAAVSATDWERLEPSERAHYAREHLRSLDPRLLPRAILVWAGRRSRRRSRHFNH